MLSIQHETFAYISNICKKKKKIWESTLLCLLNVIKMIQNAFNLMSLIDFVLYYILSTCNKFDNIQIKQRWDLISALHHEFIEKPIGPLIRHGSHRDSRRRKCMLDSINRGSYNLKVKDLQCLLK